MSTARPPSAGQPVSRVATRVVAADGQAHVAYRHYLDHSQNCLDCDDGACDTGATLWKAYREARDGGRPGGS